MARFYQVFSSKEAQQHWEDAQKRKDPHFRVCLRMTGRQLAEDLCLPPDHFWPYKYATVYTVDEKKGDK